MGVSGVERSISRRALAGCADVVLLTIISSWPVSNVTVVADMASGAERQICCVRLASGEVNSGKRREWGASEGDTNEQRWATRPKQTMK